MSELRTAWIREKPENKERVIAQFNTPITKNQQLNAYEANRHSKGYNSDYTTNTQNSDGTYTFQALQAGTEFDTSASVNSNGKIEGNLPSILTVNAAASKSILRNNKHHPDIYRDLQK